MVDTHATVTLITYNLWHGRAQRELGPLVEERQPDVLCVQEAVASSLPARIGPLERAVSTARNRLTLAVYLRSSRLEAEHASPFALAASRHDRLVGGTDQRLAAVRVHDRETGRRFVVGSFHATPFTDSNAARRRQVDEAHGALSGLGPGLPWLMAGDYNHPFLLFMLRAHLARKGVGVARAHGTTYHRDGRLMRGSFDLATTSGFEVTGATVLPQGASDHLPVEFEARITH